jgi:hypothetical protein
MLWFFLQEVLSYKEWLKRTLYMLHEISTNTNRIIRLVEAVPSLCLSLLKTAKVISVKRQDTKNAPNQKREARGSSLEAISLVATSFQCYPIDSCPSPLIYRDIATAHSVSVNCQTGRKDNLGSVHSRYRLQPPTNQPVNKQHVRNQEKVGHRRYVFRAVVRLTGWL